MDIRTGIVSVHWEFPVCEQHFAPKSCYFSIIYRNIIWRFTFILGAVVLNLSEKNKLHPVNQWRGNGHDMMPSISWSTTAMTYIHDTQRLVVKLANETTDMSTILESLWTDVPIKKKLRESNPPFDKLYGNSHHPLCSDP